MRTVIFLLVTAAVVIALAWGLAGLAGHVTATLGNFTIQMATPLAIVAIIVLVVLLVLVLQLLLGLPGRFGRWRARRRREEGERRVTSTLVAIAAGNQAHARSHAARARRLLGDTPQTLLYAAEAARLAGHEDEAEALYKRLAERSDSSFLGLRGLFRQAMARKDFDLAALHAKAAEKLHPGIEWLRAERAELAIRTSNWQQALRLAGPESPTAAFAVAAASAETDAAKGLKLAGRAMKDAPGFLPAILAYATRLREAGRESRAQAILRDAWKKDPHPEIATLALAPHSDPTERQKAGSKLAQNNPGHPESLMLLAQLALANNQPEDARRHAEAAHNAGFNQQRLWRLMAEIEAKHGSGGAALITSKDALRLASHAEPDPVWRCESCGSQLSAWSAVCPVCQTPGRVVWGTAKAAPARISAS